MNFKKILMEIAVELAPAQTSQTTNQADYGYGQGLPSWGDVKSKDPNMIFILKYLYKYQPNIYKMIGSTNNSPQNVIMSKAWKSGSWDIISSATEGIYFINNESGERILTLEFSVDAKTKKRIIKAIDSAKKQTITPI